MKAPLANGPQIIVRGSSSAVAGQITEDARKHNLRNPGPEVVYLNMGAEALELTGEKCHFYPLRMSPNAAIRFKTVANVTNEAGTLGDQVNCINQNYSWGVDVENTVVVNAPEVGYEVLETTLHEVSKIQDFSPYVAMLIPGRVADRVAGGARMSRGRPSPGSFRLDCWLWGS